MLKWSISQDGQLSRVRSDSQCGDQESGQLITTNRTTSPLSSSPQHYLTPLSSGTYCLASSDHPMAGVNAADISQARYEYLADPLQTYVECQGNSDLGNGTTSNGGHHYVNLHAQHYSEPYVSGPPPAHTGHPHQHPYEHLRHSRSKSQTCSSSDPSNDNHNHHSQQPLYTASHPSAQPHHGKTGSGTVLPGKSCLKPGSCVRPIPLPLHYADGGVLTVNPSLANPTTNGTTTTASSSLARSGGLVRSQSTAATTTANQPQRPDIKHNYAHSADLPSKTPQNHTHRHHAHARSVDTALSLASTATNPAHHPISPITANHALPPHAPPQHQRRTPCSTSAVVEPSRRPLSEVQGNLQGHPIGVVNALKDRHTSKSGSQSQLNHQQQQQRHHHDQQQQSKGHQTTSKTRPPVTAAPQGHSKSASEPVNNTKVSLV